MHEHRQGCSPSQVVSLTRCTTFVVMKVFAEDCFPDLGGLHLQRALQNCCEHRCCCIAVNVVTASISASLAVTLASGR